MFIRLEIFERRGKRKRNGELNAKTKLCCDRWEDFEWKEGDEEKEDGSVSLKLD